MHFLEVYIFYLFSWPNGTYSLDVYTSISDVRNNALSAFVQLAPIVSFGGDTGRNVSRLRPRVHVITVPDRPRG